MDSPQSVRSNSSSIGGREGGGISARRGGGRSGKAGSSRERKVDKYDKQSHISIQGQIIAERVTGEMREEEEELVQGREEEEVEKLKSSQ